MSDKYFDAIKRIVKYDRETLIQKLRAQGRTRDYSKTPTNQLRDMLIKIAQDITFNYLSPPKDVRDRTYEIVESAESKAARLPERAIERPSLVKRPEERYIIANDKLWTYYGNSFYRKDKYTLYIADPPHDEDILQEIIARADLHGSYNLSFWKHTAKWIPVGSKFRLESINHRPFIVKGARKRLRAAIIADTLSNIVKGIYDNAYYDDFVVAISNIPIERIPYPPVYHGDINCAIKVYRKYIPKGRNGKAFIKYFDNLKLTDGFTQEVAQQINNDKGYGCTMYDQLGNMIFDINTRNKMKHIKLQAFDQHVYEYNEPLTTKYNPQRVEVYTGDFYELAARICDHGPQFIYRTDVNTLEHYIAGLKTANVEYKMADYPIGVYDQIDVIMSGLRSKYPHNFTSRDPAELEYIKLADYHTPTIWYDNPQSGYEIDFNQAYRAAAELKLSEYTQYAFPHWPVFWIEVTNINAQIIKQLLAAVEKSNDYLDISEDDIYEVKRFIEEFNNKQTLALRTIEAHSGFAHLTDLDFSAVGEPLRGYITAQNKGRFIFTSPEIAYFNDIGAVFTIRSIAYNQMNQNIDWGFYDNNESLTPKMAKNINRISMGRIIMNPDKYTSKIMMDKAVTPYYRSLLSDKVVHIDDASDKYDLITYEREIKNKFNAQYHIHAYILTYLRIAMWDLLSNIDPTNVIKINIDAVHVKKSVEVNFEIDNSPMGKLGAIKINKTITRGFRFIPVDTVQKMPDVSFPDSFNDLAQLTLLGGAAGSGKTKTVSKQPALTHIAAFQNKLSVALHKQVESYEHKSITTQTMHKMYGVEFADPKFTVTRIPPTHLHNLDDILLAPPKLVQNIVSELVKHGKRITITYGPGQATMNKPAAIELIKYLESVGFNNKIITGSARMEPQLYEISEKYRNDPRHPQILSEQGKLNKIRKDIITKCKIDNCCHEECVRENILWKIQRKFIFNIIDSIMNDYVPLFDVISPDEAIKEYMSDIKNSDIVVSTNILRHKINDEILSRGPTLHKYRYTEHVRRKVGGKPYRKFKGEIITINPDEIDAQLRIDIDKGHCEHMHVYTVHSYQGETAPGDIYINVATMFDADIFYSAITRPRLLSNIKLFKLWPEDSCGSVPEPVEENELIPVPVVIPIPVVPQNPLIDSSLGKIAPLSFDKLENAHGNLVVRSEYPYNHYLSFESTDHFYNWAQRQPEDQRCYHEVVRTDLRKLVIDIDGENIPCVDWPTVGDIFISNFISTYNRIYTPWGESPINVDSLAILNASGYSKTKSADKFSLQIRTRVVVTDRTSCKQFARLYKSTLGQYSRYVDMGVYKRNQCFRIIGSTKLDDNRHSRIIGNTGIDDCWVQDLFFNYALDPIAVKKPEINNCVSVDVSTQKIIDAAAPYTVGLTYKWCGHHTFKRLRTSHCVICDREHTSENMFVTIDNGVVNLRCYRNPSTIIELFKV